MKKSMTMTSAGMSKAVDWTATDMVIGLKSPSKSEASFVVDAPDSPVMVQRPVSKINFNSVETNGFSNVTQAPRQKLLRNAKTIDRQCDVTYKVLMLGDSGVGKTALLRHLTGKEFCSSHVSTIGKPRYQNNSTL